MTSLSWLLQWWNTQRKKNDLWSCSVQSKWAEARLVYRKIWVQYACKCTEFYKWMARLMAVDCSMCWDIAWDLKALQKQQKNENCWIRIWNYNHEVKEEAQEWPNAQKKHYIVMHSRNLGTSRWNAFIFKMATIKKVTSNLWVSCQNV